MSGTLVCISLISFQVRPFHRLVCRKKHEPLLSYQDFSDIDETVHRLKFFSCVIGQIKKLLMDIFINKFGTVSNQTCSMIKLRSGTVKFSNAVYKRTVNIFYTPRPDLIKHQIVSTVHQPTYQ